MSWIRCHLSCMGWSTPLDADRSPFAHWRRLPVSAVRISDGFWAAKQVLNRDTTLVHGYRMLEEAGNLDNLRIAAGRSSGEFRGRLFNDSDVYKWLEAIAYQSAQREVEPGLREQANAIIELIEAAQAPDGYLDTYYQLTQPDQRWTDLPHGHEMYCAGHLIQAAVAYQQCVGDGRLLSVARRLADHIDSVFGPGKRQGVCGHPEIEMALVELFRETGERRYLDLAQYFVDQRGHGTLGPSRFGGSAYYQDRVPVREAREVEGHAVRAMYLASGVADLYLETGEDALLEALRRQWRDMVTRKMYVTGGTGSRHSGEGFGYAYELPNERAYCETCAAIGSIFWSWRMLLATGESRFADLIEWTLYNGFLSGLSLDGERFFYVNPLLSRGEPERLGRGGPERSPWHATACCPPNIMRLLASLGQYVATTGDHGLQVHHYMSGSIEASLASGRQVGLQVETRYPWSERIRISVTRTIEDPWELRLRVPAWCERPRLMLAGQDVEVDTATNGYVGITRGWSVGDEVELHLPLEPKFVSAHPRVDAARDCLAITRGPMVYCVEQTDHAGASVLDLEVSADAPLESAWCPDVLGGVEVVHARGQIVDTTGWEGRLYQDAGAPSPRREIRLTAIPYHVWANRGPAAMRVWIPRTAAR